MRRAEPRWRLYIDPNAAQCPGCKRVAPLIGRFCLDCVRDRQLIDIAPNVAGLVSFLRMVYADGATKLATDTMFSAWPKLERADAVLVLSAELPPGRSAVDILRDRLDGAK